MIWSELHGDMEDQASRPDPIDSGIRRWNVKNGPKVRSALALVKSGCMLESLS
jgi:hypothetical protein